ncbi:MAG: putative rhizobiocin/RTX toxin and hemolysin-type calcium-binding protein, partial [Rhodocyclaceae bacterium]
AGANVLDGGAGIDILKGGVGSDTYVVDLIKVGTLAVLQDTVTEILGDAGSDTLQLRTGAIPVLSPADLGLATATTFTLAATLENLDASLSGSNKLNLTGNTLANTLTGNDAANLLDGGLGNDTLNGGAGNDTLKGGAGNGEVGAGDTADFSDIAVGVTVDLGVVDGSGFAAAIAGSAIDKLKNTENLTGGAGNDTLTGDGSDNVLTGNAGNDTLTGGAGNDTLKGGPGNDTLDGGAGNDTADFSDATLAVTVVLAAGTAGTGTATGGSTDILIGIENLIGGGGGDTLSGDDNDNVLTGNAGNDTLKGGAGNDTLLGGLGNDTYIVDDMQDTLSEAAAGGTDTVRSSVNFSLVDTDGAGANGGNIEHLTLTGLDIDGTGNSLVNTITGSAGANVLDGGAGIDILKGGVGSDTYVVDLIKVGT